jgi:Di-haem oxidoreductase, putative peroxidase
MARLRFVYACLVASRACMMLGFVFACAPALAQSDPGVRGGPLGAGGPLANLVPSRLGFFRAATSSFTQVNSVTGTIDDGAPLGVANGGPALGPRYNLNQCSGCHAQPAVGGTSPKVSPEVAVATLRVAQNDVPSFVTLNGPIREARFVKNPDGTPDGFVHELYTIIGRADAPSCNTQQPNVAAQLSSHNVVFRIPTPVFGLGLVEEISDIDLMAAFNGNSALKSRLNISGHFNINPDDGTIARFSPKAQDKSLLHFSRIAYNVEIGVTNELFPNKVRIETSTNCQFNPLPEDMSIFGTMDPVSPPTGSTASDFSTGIVNFAAFMRLLAPPTPARAPTFPPNAAATASSTRGSTVFNDIGCQTLSCYATNDGDKRLSQHQRPGDTKGYLEKLISVPIADAASVNVYESEREQSRIIRRQFCGARPVGAIFRGALNSFSDFGVHKYGNRAGGRNYAGNCQWSGVS